MESNGSPKHCTTRGLTASQVLAFFRASFASSLTSFVGIRLSRGAITSSTPYDDLSCDEGPRLLYAER